MELAIPGKRAATARCTYKKTFGMVRWLVAWLLGSDGEVANINRKSTPICYSLPAFQQQQIEDEGLEAWEYQDHS